MSLHTPARWIVTYDITDRRRLLRVHALLRRRGLPVQYSVFLVRASADGMRRLMEELEELIVTALDDVRAYRWPVQPECHQLGRSILPEGVLLEEDAPPGRQRSRRCLVAG